MRRGTERFQDCCLQSGEGSCRRPSMRGWARRLPDGRDLVPFEIKITLGDGFSWSIREVFPRYRVFLTVARPPHGGGWLQSLRPCHPIARPAAILVAARALPTLAVNRSLCIDADACQVPHYGGLSGSGSYRLHDHGPFGARPPSPENGINEQNRECYSSCSSPPCRLRRWIRSGRRSRSRGWSCSRGIGAGAVGRYRAGLHR